MKLIQYGWGLAPPATPVGLAAAAGDSLVALSWPASSGATGYNLKRSLGSSGTYIVIATNWPGLVFTNSGLANGTVYYFVVSATNMVGESANSAPVGVIPLSSVATSIRFAAGNGQFQINWPQDRTGWLLQMRTNSLLGTNWLTISGSGGTNQMSFPINQSVGSDFFRLVHP